MKSSLLKLDLAQYEAKQLVWMYYAVQKLRIRAKNQIVACEKQGRSHKVLDHYYQEWINAEKSVKSVLARYAKQSDIGEWMLSIRGVGPIITAGFVSELDFTVPSPGHFWSYCGLVKGRDRPKKGQKIPYNKKLKRLCFILGECFIKTKNYSDGYYGKMYDKRKEHETQKNLRGEYADQAAQVLKEYKIQSPAAKKVLKRGRLTAQHIHMRSLRWTVKLFLSHLHCVGFYITNGYLPPRPYVFDHANENDEHVHISWPLNYHLVEGLEEQLNAHWTIKK